MLRTATPEHLQRLLDAAFDIDRELDTALVRLGILPPLDLATIRSWLTIEGIRLDPGVNRDGHRVLGVVLGGRTVARIHQDGTVVDCHSDALASA